MRLIPGAGRISGCFDDASSRNLPTDSAEDPQMIDLDDPRWKEFLGGYRQAYDVSLPLRRLRDGDPPKGIWKELWDELHHQGDVDIASYAAIPQLVSLCSTWEHRDWNLYGIASLIEIEKGRRGNPESPEWLAEDYQAAWRKLFDLGVKDLHDATDSHFIRMILGAFALHRGDRKLGEILVMYDASEIADITRYLNGEVD